MDKITIFDTTLRDGEQSPGGYMPREDKLMLAKRLEKLGVDVIEAGFPGSSPGDYDSVRNIAMQVEGPVIAGLARTVEKDIRAAGEALQPAIERGKGRIHTFIGTSKIHREEKLGMSLAEVCKAAENGVGIAAEYTGNIEFSAEDAMRTDNRELATVVEAAINAGATTVNIPDTVGYSLPDEVFAKIKYLFEKVPNIRRAVISVHEHGDLLNHGINSMFALEAGARQLECTINGIGERAGNCPLEVVLAHLKARPDRFGEFYCNVDAKQIAETSQLVSKLTGLVVQPHWPITGENAFKHLAGIHQHGVRKYAGTYEIIEPKDFGYESVIVIGARSGKAGIQHKFKQDFGMVVPDEEAVEVAKRIVEFVEAHGIKIMMDDELLMAYEGIQSVPERYRLEHMAIHGNSGSGLYRAQVWVRNNGSVLKSIGKGIGNIDAAVSAVKAIIQNPEGNGLVIKDHNSTSASYTSSADAIYTFYGDFKGHMIKGKARHPDTVEAATRAYIDLINKAGFMGRYI